MTIHLYIVVTIFFFLANLLLLNGIHPEICYTLCTVGSGNDFFLRASARAHRTLYKVHHFLYWDVCNLDLSLLYNPTCTNCICREIKIFRSAKAVHVQVEDLLLVGLMDLIMSCGFATIWLSPTRCYHGGERRN